MSYRPGLSRSRFAADEDPGIRLGTRRARPVCGSDQTHATDQNRAQHSRRRGRRSHRSQYVPGARGLTCQPSQVPSAPPPEDGIWSMGTAHGGSVLIVDDVGSKTSMLMVG